MNGLADLQIDRGHRAVRRWIHSVDGWSLNDCICAAQVDALLP